MVTIPGKAQLANVNDQYEMSRRKGEVNSRQSERHLVLPGWEIERGV